MDPLSAMRMMMPPDVGARLTQSVQQGAQDAVATKPIPLPELQQLDPALATQPLDSVAGAQGSNFQNFLGDFVREVSDKQAAAGEAVNGLMSGKNVSLHQAMISMEEASVSFQMMVEVRNNLLSSYQELMRMQI